MKPNKTCFLPSHIVTQVIHKVHPAQWPRMVRLPPHSSTTITQEHPLRTWARSFLVSPRWRYLHQTNQQNESIEDKKKSEFLLSMEELFRYYLRNIIILRIGTGLRYLWLRFVRHLKISYRTLYEGSKSKKTSELSNFENEMSNIVKMMSVVERKIPIKMP